MDSDAILLCLILDNNSVFVGKVAKPIYKTYNLHVALVAAIFEEGGTMKKSKSYKMPDMLGGQALLDGVMMKGKDSYSYAVYNPKDELVIRKKDLPKVNKFWSKVPIIRGIYNMYEMMKIGVESLNASAAIAMPNEKTDSGWVATTISIVISIVLFMVLPAYIFKLLSASGIENVALLNIYEGAIRLTIFILFLLLMSLDKDIRNVFAFHGAEHMTVYAYEAKEKLTVKNVSKYSRLHPRCGTAFIMLVIIISIVVYSFLGITAFPQRVLYKLLLLPLVVGVTYELIKLVIKLPRWLVTLILLPGLSLQLITTRKPGEREIKAAIAAINEVKS